MLSQDVQQVFKVSSSLRACWSNLTSAMRSKAAGAVGTEVTRKNVLRLRLLRVGPSDTGAQRVKGLQWCSVGRRRGIQSCRSSRRKQTTLIPDEGRYTDCRLKGLIKSRILGNLLTHGLVEVSTGLTSSSQQVVEMPTQALQILPCGVRCTRPAMTLRACSSTIDKSIV